MYNKIGVYAPYYKDFKCIADKCRNSYCMDWTRGYLAEIRYFEDNADGLIFCLKAGCFK